MKFKISNTLCKASAVIVSSFMAGSAYAQTDTISSVATNLAGNIYSVGDVISNASYVAGAGFTVAGVIKAKNSAQDPGQTPMSHAFGRLGAGAMLLAAPFVVNTAMNSFSSNASNASTGVNAAYSNRFQ